MPAEAKVIDLAAADNNGVCWRCSKACCNCAGCVGCKGGERDVCARCYEATVKKEATV